MPLMWRTPAPRADWRMPPAAVAMLSPRSEIVELLKNGLEFANLVAVNVRLNRG